MNRRARQILTVAFALTATVAFADAAGAAERSKQTAEAHYQKGMKAYTLGHFEDAIEEFEKAYELRQEPIFLYNIAQSHRQNNNPQRAIFFYRRFLEADPQAKNRAEIEKRIKDLESNLNHKPENAATATPTTVAPTTAAAQSPQPESPPPAVPAPLPPPSNPIVPVQAEAAPPASAGRGLRIAGIATGAVGVAGVVTGVFLGLHANTLFDEATKPGSVYDDGKYQDSKTFRTLEWVSFGVGAAAIVTGGVLYYLGYSAKSNAPSVALVPIAAPGTGGAALCGRF